MDSKETIIEYGPRVKGDPRKRVNFSLRESVHELMQVMASERGCSRSHLLETLLLDAYRESGQPASRAA